MPTGVDLSLSGLASGFDWKSFVAQIVQAERAPEAILRTRQSLIQQRNAAFANIQSLLTTLQTRAKALADPTLYDSRTAQSSDLTTATATATAGAAAGV